MSVEFFDLVRSLYEDKGPDEARTVASNLLFDTAHAIGKADARTFREKMGVVDPIERLSAGPIHFAFAGWAFVDILPESRPSPDEDYYLAYEHPFSFESHAWIEKGRRSPVPVCVMNAGYSSGWCEESFGLPLVAAETECLAAGGTRCHFVMAPPSRIEEHLARATASGAGRPRHSTGTSVPEFFQRKRLEDELRRSHESLESRVHERTADLEEANARLRAEIAERRAAEEALRASEDRFARAFQMSPVAITISTLDEGRYLDVNESFARLMGRPREALVGRTAQEIGFWPDARERDRLVARLLQGERVSEVEVILVNAGGSRREVLLSAELVDLQGRRCVLAILHDVTDRRRAGGDPAPGPEDGEPGRPGGRGGPRLQQPPRGDARAHLPRPGQAARLVGRARARAEGGGGGGARGGPDPPDARLLRPRPLPDPPHRPEPASCSRT